MCEMELFDIEMVVSVDTLKKPPFRITLRLLLSISLNIQKDVNLKFCTRVALFVLILTMSAISRDHVSPPDSIDVTDCCLAAEFAAYLDWRRCCMAARLFDFHSGPWVNEQNNFILVLHICVKVSCIRNCGLHEEFSF